MLKSFPKIKCVRVEGKGGRGRLNPSERRRYLSAGGKVKEFAFVLDLLGVDLGCPRNRCVTDVGREGEELLS